MAQAPTITITTPSAGQAIKQNEVVNAAYTCSGPGVATCEGPVASGAAIPTATIGPATFRVVAKDAAGAELGSASNSYSIVEADDTDPGGTVPATLNLTLGTPAPFTPFIPGLNQTYSTTLGATILSTAGDATLTVADPSAEQTGKLVNGMYTLAQPLQVGAVKNSAGGEPTTAPLGGSAAPTTLLTYDGPVSPAGEGAITVHFKQAIAATEALRTGAYSKTLTFTLSTTNP